MKQLLLTTIAAVLLVGCGESSIHQAAYQGNIETVKQHIAAGVDVKAKDDRGYTPLHTAALDGHKEIVELLITKGADVNAKNDYGVTPLGMSDDKETADLLRKHGGKTTEELDNSIPRLLGKETSKP